MATTFSVFSLGVLPVIDTVENNNDAENAWALEGLTFGSADDPLFNDVATMSPGTTGYDGFATIDSYTHTEEAEAFSIDGGADQVFDIAMVYNATLTYLDGTTADITAVIFQDTVGNTYWAPEFEANADHTAMTAQPIVSLELGTAIYAPDGGGLIDGYGLYADRQVLSLTDFIVEGTAGDDLINTAYGDDSTGDLIDNGDHLDASDDDSVEAGDGDDTIDAGSGDDTILGQSGDDEFYLDGTLQNDSIVGGETGEDGAGDRINFSTIADDITVTFTGAEAGTLTDGVSTTTFAEIEQMQMGTGSDSVIGSTGAENIIGNAGNDTILGGGGNDTVFSGLDNDSVEGGAGDDSIVTSDGTDYADGGTGDDELDGGAGNDSLIGGDGADGISGGAGNDTIVAGAGDVVLGGDDDDLIEVDATATDGLGALTADLVVDAGAGGTDTDTLDLSGYASYTNLVRVADGDGNSYSGKVDVTDAFGNTVTVTFTEIESLILPPSDGIVSGTAGDDTIDAAYVGDPHLDMVDNGDATGNFGEAVGSDADSVEAGSGADLVEAGAGDDTVDGGEGDDTLDGGTGADSVTGGDEDDTLLLSDGFGNDTLVGGERAELTGDTLDAGGVTGSGLVVTMTGDEAGTATDGADTAQFSEIENFTLTDQGDSFDGSGDSLGLVVDGAGGDDTLAGGSGADELRGGLGADRISLGSGDEAEGGDGDDTFVISPSDFLGTDAKLSGGETGETDGDMLVVNSFQAVVTPTGAESGTVTFQDGSTVHYHEIETVVVTCFTPGTRIKTARGEVDAEQIAKGDWVLTRDNGYQQVTWSGRRDLDAADLSRTPEFAPVFIPAGALGPSCPERDMVVSPQHRVMMSSPETQLLFAEDEVLVAAADLVGRFGIRRMRGARQASYIHFMFNQHELVMSDGIWTESFQPGQAALRSMDNAQRDEILALFPALASDQVTAAFEAARPTLKHYQTRLLLAA